MPPIKTPNPKQNRDCWIGIRVTADEKMMFQQKAMKMFGGNISRLILNAVEHINEKKLIEKYRKVDELTQVYNQLSYELKKSGINLNQAAKQLNTAMLKYGDQPPSGILRRIAEETVEPAVELQNDLLDMLSKIFSKLLSDIMKAR